MYCLYPVFFRSLGVKDDFEKTEIRPISSLISETKETISSVNVNGGVYIMLVWISVLIA